MSTSDASNADPEAPSPRRVRLPGFVSDEDIGLGDLIKQATAALGIAPCGGCERRAALLNQWMSFTRWR